MMLARAAHRRNLLAGPINALRDECLDIVGKLLIQFQRPFSPVADAPRRANRVARGNEPHFAIARVSASASTVHLSRAAKTRLYSSATARCVSARRACAVLPCSA